MGVGVGLGRGEPGRNAINRCITGTHRSRRRPLPLSPVSNGRDLLRRSGSFHHNPCLVTFTVRPGLVSPGDLGLGTQIIAESSGILQ